MARRQTNKTDELGVWEYVVSRAVEDSRMPSLTTDAGNDVATLAVSSKALRRQTTTSTATPIPKAPHMLAGPGAAVPTRRRDHQ